MKKIIEELKNWKNQIIWFPAWIFLTILFVFVIEWMDPGAGPYNPYQFFQSLAMAYCRMLAASLAIWVILYYVFKPYYNQWKETKDTFSYLPPVQRAWLALALFCFLYLMFMYAAVNP